MNTRILLLASLVAAAATFTTGCPQPTDNKPPPQPSGLCETSDECPTGHVCSAGACVIGSCDPNLEAACDGAQATDAEKPYCCKPWEICGGVDFQCKNDPNVHGIGCDQNDPGCTPCENQDDCAPGQFCSGAACFDAAGRTNCTSSFQCSAGERCDKNVFLCVPDRGGCEFCDSFSELCCEEAQACSTETGFCVDIPAPECDNPGTQDTCPNGQFCDDVRRCSQCDATNADCEAGNRCEHQCGPGLDCDVGVGNCHSIADQCDSDADCLGNKRCVISDRTCVIPQCTSDGECHEIDSRDQCNLDRFECFLPPAICDGHDTQHPADDNEPNDTTATATPMTDGNTYSGVLCRGNTDVLSFPVIPNKLYTATVDFGGSGQAGIVVQVLNTDLQLETSASFTSTQSSVQIAGQTGASESGTFYVRVDGNNNQRDSWHYTVTIAEDDPSVPADCSASAQALEEPNDDFDQAIALAPGTPKVFSRCGTDDVDFFQIPLSPLHSLQITVDQFRNLEGNLNVDIFSAPSTSSRVSGLGGATSADFETVTPPEGPAIYYLKVSLASPNSAVANQTYRISVTEVPRPSQCDPDPTENDGDISVAPVLALVADQSGADPDHNLGYYLADGQAPDGTDDASAIGPVRCNPQDKDLFKFTMPPNLGGAVQLRFNQNEGDMALDLLDATGAQIATSNSSTATSVIDEQVTIPGSTVAADYYARARLAGSTGGTTGQHYSLEIHTFDNAQCIASEPNGGDDTFATERCIGTTADYSNAATNSSFACSAFIAEPLVPGDCGVAAPNTPGCGRACGADDVDGYRVGKLKKNQGMHARLVFDPDQGLLDLVRQSVNLGSSTVTNTTVSATAGVADMYFVETSSTLKEYGVQVKPKGTSGHQLQPYTLTIEKGAECDDDEFDTGAGANEKPSTATPLGHPGTTLIKHESRCDADVDVYEIISFGGDTVTFSIDQDDPSPAGIQAELGLRPSDLNQIPATVITALPGQGAKTFANPVTQDLYITVRMPSSTVKVTGPYTLTVTSAP